MENNEIVVYDKEGKIINCNFERVDLTDPASINSYCTNQVSTVGNVLDSTAQMSIETDQEIVDSKRISEIPNFRKELDESEKEQKSTSLVKKGKQLLANMGIKYFKESLEKESYKGRYEAYCDMLNYVATAIEHQKQNTLNDIEFKNGIIAEMIPLIKQLEEMIIVGYSDKEQFDIETEQMRQNINENDIDLKDQIEYRTKCSEIFNAKLASLSNILIVYKSEVHSTKLAQVVDYTIVSNHDKYLVEFAPVLKSEGALMVNNRIQTEKLAQAHALNQAVNNAIMQNAKDLLTNIESSVDLYVNGGIQTQTLEVVTGALDKGLELFKNASKAKQDKIKKEEQSRKEVKNKINKFNEEFLNFMDSEFVEGKVIEGTTGQKRIGGK